MGTIVNKEVGNERLREQSKDLRRYGSTSNLTKLMKEHKHAVDGYGTKTEINPSWMKKNKRIMSFNNFQELIEEEQERKQKREARSRVPVTIGEDARVDLKDEREKKEDSKEITKEKLINFLERIKDMNFEKKNGRTKVEPFQVVKRTSISKGKGGKGNSSVMRGRVDSTLEIEEVVNHRKGEKISLDKETSLYAKKVLAQHFEDENLWEEEKTKKERAEDEIMTKMRVLSKESVRNRKHTVEVLLFGLEDTFTFTDIFLNFGLAESQLMHFKLKRYPYLYSWTSKHGDIHHNQFTLFKLVDVNEIGKYMDKLQTDDSFSDLNESELLEYYAKYIIKYYGKRKKVNITSVRILIIMLLEKLKNLPSVRNKPLCLSANSNLFTIPAIEEHEPPIAVQLCAHVDRETPPMTEREIPNIGGYYDILIEKRNLGNLDYIRMKKLKKEFFSVDNVVDEQIKRKKMDMHRRKFERLVKEIEPEVGITTGVLNDVFEEHKEPSNVSSKDTKSTLGSHDSFLDDYTISEDSSLRSSDFSEDGEFEEREKEDTLSAMEKSHSGRIPPEPDDLKEEGTDSDDDLNS